VSPSPQAPERAGGCLPAPPVPLSTALLAALTLGLAPFVPEPHLVEKARWLLTGAPFRPIDVFDVVLHGTPWLLVAWALLARRAPGVT
jgi:hypothetical protein